MKQLIIHLIPLLLILSILLIPASAYASDIQVNNTSNSLVITQPSVNETTFAEKRDFYVYGIFPTRLEHPGDIRIELFKGDGANGEQIRHIESRVDPDNGTTPLDSIETNYSEGLNWGNVMVADLVKEPGGFLNPSNKVVVTNEYYQGLILGGVTKDFDTTYQDRDGKPLQDLTAGNYTIQVTGLSGDLEGQVAEKTITFGLTDSMFGTDRPPINLQNRFLYAWTHNLRVDRDWFPGYFLYPENNNTGYSVPKRWNPNNAIESVNDLNGTIIDTPAVANNSLIIYNINEKSTVYGVELSAILKYGLEDNKNTTFLHYDIGEPSLSVFDQKSGKNENITGSLVPFVGDDRMVITRAEIYSPDLHEEENLYDPWNVSTAKLVLDVSKGITLNEGEHLLLFGVTKPIHSSVNETAIPHRFMIENRIASITYVVSDARGNEVEQSSHDVNLSRLFTQGSPSRYNSIFEFGHEFNVTAHPGEYTIKGKGMDTHGEEIPGTEISIPVSVTSL